MWHDAYTDMQRLVENSPQQSTPFAMEWKVLAQIWQLNIVCGLWGLLMVMEP